MYFQLTPPITEYQLSTSCSSGRVRVRARHTVSQSPAFSAPFTIRLINHHTTTDDRQPKHQSLSSLHHSCFVFSIFFFFLFFFFSFLFFSVLFLYSFIHSYFFLKHFSFLFPTCVYMYVCTHVCATLPVRPLFLVPSPGIHEIIDDEYVLYNTDQVPVHLRVPHPNIFQKKKKKRESRGAR